MFLKKAESSIVGSYDLLNKKPLEVYGVSFSVKDYKQMSNNNFIINKKQIKMKKIKEYLKYPIVVANPDYNIDNIKEACSNFKIAYADSN